MSFTKILATIGPKTQSLEMLTALLDAGMTAVRMNFSHGDHAYHATTIANVRQLAAERGQHIPLVLDTKGPEIRTGKLVDGQAISLQKGREITVTTESILGDAACISIDYPTLADDVVVWGKIMLADGLIALEVKERLDAQRVRCVVMNDGTLGEKKNVNLPGVIVKLPALAEKDKEDLRFACEQKVDYVAASFVRKASDVDEIRAFLETYGGKYIKIIAKIENQEWVANLDAIIAKADGIMVARGDLGVDVPLEEMPLLQKTMIQKTNAAGKLAVTATQMLESMIMNPRPTRAEVTDVANAILDGTDVVMLSGETASGSNPIEAVTTMAKICQTIDPEQATRHLHDNLEEIADSDIASAITRAIARGAVQTARAIDAKAIVVLSKAGTTLRQIRKYNPHCELIVLTTYPQVARQLILFRGVRAQIVEEPLNYTDVEHYVRHDISVWSPIVLTWGGSISWLGVTDMIKIMV